MIPPVFSPVAAVHPLTLPLIFISGILGSAHCIGMCGGISATIGLGAGRLSTAFFRQLWWSLGRTFTYMFLGMLSATMGAKIMGLGGHAAVTQAVFAVCAGLFLTFQGLHTAGWLRLPIGRRAGAPCVATSLWSRFLRGGSSLTVFLAGVMTGFLPCGLVYSFLTLAASSGSVAQGLLIMLSFGLGTIPVMVLAGGGMSLLSLSARRSLLRLAAACLLATGIMTLGHGVAFAAQAADTTKDAGCPFCATSAPANLLGGAE